MTEPYSRWFHIFQPSPGALVRLFCFPYAGATTVVYRPWLEWLPDFVELVAVEYPGHGRRLKEPLLHQIPQYVSPLVEALHPMQDKPFVFFGHSMGALVSFEVVRALRRSQLPLPFHLFVSGRSAPHIPETTDPPLYSLPEDEFKEKLRELNGTPEEVLNHEELMELLIPVLRCDFEACETYQYREEPPLSIPISALGGLEDVSVPPDNIRAWQVHTQARFVPHFFPGGHFFIHHHVREVVQIVIREVEQGLRCGIAG